MYVASTSYCHHIDDVSCSIVTTKSYRRANQQRILCSSSSRGRQDYGEPNERLEHEAAEKEAEDPIKREEDLSRTITSSIDTKTGEFVTKATFQPQLLDGKTVLDDFDNAPWVRTFHLNERNLVWHDDMKRRLYNKVASEELSMGEEELEEYLQRLEILMPDARDKMRSMSIDTLSRLIGTIDELPYKLMMLKRVFPNANATLLAIRTPELVLGVEEETLCGIAEELRAMFPRLEVDKLIEENPSMLDIEGLKNAMEEAKRIMPSLDIEHAMGSDPQLILGFQRGSFMISGGYD